MILRRSFQVVSSAWELATRPALMAAERMTPQPRASHAAGTVSQTSAESTELCQRRKSEESRAGRTKICDYTNITCNLFLRIFPETTQKILDEVNRTLPGLQIGVSYATTVIFQ